MVQFARGSSVIGRARGELAPPRRRRALRGRRRSRARRGSCSAGRSAPSGGSRRPRGVSASPPASGGVLFVSRGGVSFPGACVRARFASAVAAGAEAGQLRRRRRAGRNGAPRSAEFVPRAGEQRRRGRSRERRRQAPTARVAASAPPAAGCRRGAARPPARPGAGAAAPAGSRGRRLRRGHPKRRNARWERAEPRGAVAMARPRSDNCAGRALARVLAGAVSFCRSGRSERGKTMVDGARDIRRSPFTRPEAAGASGRTDENT